MLRLPANLMLRGVTLRSIGIPSRGGIETSLDANDTGVRSWLGNSLGLKMYFALAFDPVALNLKPQNSIHLYTTNSTVYNST